MMKRFIFSTFILAAFCTSTVARENKEEFKNSLRAPATPLVTVDPYFSLWSESDELTADVTRHWSGWKQPLLGAVRVDGVTYRILGRERMNPEWRDGNRYTGHGRKDVDEFYWKESEEYIPRAARQISRNITPTTTTYTFSCGQVEVDMIFTAPLLLENVDLLARPVNYISWKVRAKDGKKHSAQVYLEASPRFAIDLNVIPVKANTGCEEKISYARCGSVEQNILGKAGDDIRIDWGYFYMGSASKKASFAVVNYKEARSRFSACGKLPKDKENVTSENFETDGTSLACCLDLGKEGEGFVMLSYDDIRSVRYLNQELRPYWNRKGDNTICKEMKKASDEYSKVLDLCKTTDRKITDEAIASGGQKYAELCALAYRQCLAAHKLVESPKGELFFFSKENFSNGCIGTVDVTYPSMPLMLLYNNNIAKALLNFIFDYSESEHWNKTWAPHDVGRYPNAYGQHYGNHMPLEESGNMLLLTAAVCKMDGNPEYAAKHWTALTMWALFAVQNGQMPENQLCTDDFAGKLAHNVNLSAKSILGVAAYASLAKQLGKKDEAEAFSRKAAEMAKKWKDAAFEQDHYRLAFDAEGTWSQKYNLVWDKVLGLGVFDEDVFTTETAWYLGKMNKYGLPLDSRKTYTKTDWIMWTATMAPDRETFLKFTDPVWNFYNETVDRIPLGDWVDTDGPTHRNMQARSVVGGFYMKMLYDRIRKQ